MPSSDHFLNCRAHADNDKYNIDCSWMGLKIHSDLVLNPFYRVDQCLTRVLLTTLYEYDGEPFACHPCSIIRLEAQIVRHTFL